MVECNMSRIDFFMFSICSVFFLGGGGFLSERGALEAQKVNFYCNNGTPKKKESNLSPTFCRGILEKYIENTIINAPMTYD